MTTHRSLPARSARRRSAGVSLLELVVVILIFVTLLSVGLPRYRDAQRYGRMAMLDNLALTMQRAAEMFHLQCLSQQPLAAGGDCAQLQVGLQTVRGERGFPVAGLDGIGRLAGLVQGDPAAAYFNTQSVLSDGVPALKVSVRHAEDGTCELIYRAPERPGERPRVAIVQSTCS